MGSKPKPVAVHSGSRHVIAGGACPGKCEVHVMTIAMLALRDQRRWRSRHVVACGRLMQLAEQLAMDVSFSANWQVLRVGRGMARQCLDAGPRLRSLG